MNKLEKICLVGFICLLSLIAFLLFTFDCPDCDCDCIGVPQPVLKIIDCEEPPEIDCIGEIVQKQHEAKADARILKEVLDETDNKGKI